jgi:hypothetical protein
MSGSLHELLHSTERRLRTIQGVTLLSVHIAFERRGNDPSFSGYVIDTILTLYSNYSSMCLTCIHPVTVLYTTFTPRPSEPYVHVLYEGNALG